MTDTNESLRGLGSTGLLVAAELEKVRSTIDFNELRTGARAADDPSVRRAAEEMQHLASLLHTEEAALIDYKRYEERPTPCDCEHCRRNGADPRHVRKGDRLLTFRVLVPKAADAAPKG